MARLDIFVNPSLRKSKQASEEKTPPLHSSQISYVPLDEHVNLLADGIRSIPGYHKRKAYVKEKILPKDPSISFEKLANLVGISKGEAIVILFDIYWMLVEEETAKFEASLG